MENLFRFYIQDKAGLYYYINGNVVSLTSTKTPINYAPQNWDVTQLDWERGFKYHGIVRKTSTTFEFHKDSANILRSIYYASGVNGYAKFVIERFNNTLAVQDYELLYDGEINFVSYRSTLYGVQCEIIEGGFLNKLESREDTNYDIDLYTNPNQIWVKMDGINLQEVCHFISRTAGFILGGNGFDIFYPFNVFTTEGNVRSDYTDPDPLIPINSVVTNTSNNAVTYNIQLSGVVDIDFYLYNTPPAFFKIRILERNALGVLLSNTTIFLSPSINNVGYNTINVPLITTAYTLPSGHSLGITSTLIDSLGLGFTNISWEIIDSALNLQISSDIRTPTSYIKCLRPINVFSELINKIGDNTTTANSQLLDVVNNDKVITSFDSVRNLPNSKLNTNFKDFYESMNNIFNTCLIYDKINNIVSLESKSTAYDNSTSVLDLGEISEFEIIPHTNDLFSKLEASYKDNNYDSVNGKDEFNTLNEFLSPLTAVSTSLNLSETYRADMYGIELTRLNLTGKTVTDGDSDNDIAVIHIENTIVGQIPIGNPGEGEDYYELYRDNTLTISNIYSPRTAYNIFFSPKRCLLRQGNYLRSLMYGNDTDLIKYQISSKNNELGLKMLTNDGTTIIDEGADILISSLDSIIFKPTIFQFKTKVNSSLDTIMNATPYQLCSFTFKNNTYYGFFIKSSLQPAFNETQTFRLLCAPQTDLTNLIY
jgi:hypothetical protein